MTEKNNKKVMYSIIGIAIILISLVGVTYSFFNYTRTGSPNTIATGRIYFNSSQNGTLQLTNVFPLTSTQAESASLDSVTVAIQGDTTYVDGEEFQITIVDVNNTINGKSIPINYMATYTTSTGGNIGTSSNDYFNAREDKDDTIYQLNAMGSVEEDAQVLVGYIDNGATGINGTLSIKAYIDADRIAISDTYDASNPGKDNMGTTSSWVNGRTVFTTTEWNSFQTNSTQIRFKIKAESNEGIWVEEPAQGTIESCPNCKFIYTTDSLWTTWSTNNQSPTVLTSGYSTNYNDIVTNSGKNYFLGVVTNASNQITNAYACGIYNGTTPFCIEGTADGANYSSNSSFINGSNLWNNTCTVGSDYTECGSRDGSSVSAFADSDGIVEVGVSNHYYCYVRSYGGVRCYEYGGVG